MRTRENKKILAWLRAELKAIEAKVCASKKPEQRLRNRAVVILGEITALLGQ